MTRTIFFSKFDESVGAVAFNWCCYGSGWHILRPGPNVPEQFEHRSPREFFENLTVKSFVRIKQMRLEYADPHRFFVEGRIVEPSGRDVVWSDTQRHHTAEAPDWGHGAVLHYAVRSAEHYIEKVKRRSDIRTATDIQFFAWWDKNDDHVPLPKSRLEKMNDILFMIQYGIAQSRVAYLSKLEPVATGDERPVYEAFFLSTYFGGVLCADAATGTLTSADEHQDAGASRTPVILFLPQDLKNPAFLVAADPEGTPIYIYGESQVSHCIPFKATRVSETQVVLQSVTRKLFMTCFDHRSTAASEYRVKILAAWAKEWENLTLLPLPDALAHDPRIAAWKGILSGGLSLSRFKGADSDFAAWPDFFAALLATKPERERTTFLAKNDLDELPWIGRMAAISF